MGGALAQQLWQASGDKEQLGESSVRVSAAAPVPLPRLLWSCPPTLETHAPPPPFLPLPSPQDIKLSDRGLVWNTDLVEAVELENLLMNAAITMCVGGPPAGAGGCIPWCPLVRMPPACWAC